MHRMRAACDAILVGVGTIVADDPALRVKPAYATGPDPLRVVLDTRGRTPPDARVLDDGPTLIVCAPDAAPVAAGSRVARVAAGPGGLDLPAVLDELGDRGVRDVMVEGGGRVLRSFLEAGLVDSWTLYVAPLLVGGDGPRLWPGPAGAPFQLGVEDAQRLGDGMLWTLRPVTPA